MSDRQSLRLRRYLHLELIAEAPGGDRTPGLARDLESAWRYLTVDEVRWLRARQPGENVFGDDARARKVLAILAVVPPEVTAREVARVPPAGRVTIASAAGCRPPSETTWKMLVDAVEARTAGAPRRSRA